MQHKQREAGKFDHVRGIISMHPNGYGFVQPEDAGAEEIFIPPSKSGYALPGDKVMVRLRPGRPVKGHREGAVIKIIEHAISEVIGFYNGTYVVPRDERISTWFLVTRAKSMRAASGDLVRATITEYPSPSGQASAEVVEILGKEMTAGLESRIILRQYGFPEDFSGQVRAELGSIPQKVGAEEFEGRVSLVDLPMITIDPVDARDFDDAVSAKKFDWGFRLWVAIADVSRYVQPGTEIDFQAYSRATSVYFPDRAIPMLPEAISSGVASLRPDEDRLAMVVEIDYDPAGKPQKHQFYPAVIRSCLRMNYVEVQDILEENKPERLEKYQPVVGMILEMSALARILHNNHKRRGSIDLDLPEAHIDLDESGEPVDIYPYPRLFSHRLVEEFMLQANQAVAEFLTSKKQGLPFRIHEPPAPDKIKELDDFLSALGLPLLAKAKSPTQVRPKDFQHLIDRAAKTPLSEFVSYIALRSMMQAKYSPENKGHFGLALAHYCHFTSPIRRYPDLMVHRILKQALGFGKNENFFAPADLAEASEHCSERERAATDAEREMSKVYQARFMSRHLGEQFEGRISGLINEGFFVETKRPMTEGMVRANQLPGYEYNARLHTAFVNSPKMELHLGDLVLVELESVEIEHREINFRLLGILESAFTRPASSILPEPKKERFPRGRKKGQRDKRPRRKFQ